jgi:hypothetical protein
MPAQSATSKPITRSTGPRTRASTSSDSISESASAGTSRQKASSSASTRPSHYQRYDPEPITVIERWGLGFALGNVLKYIVRAKHKGAELRDLRKALWYLARHIDVREAELAGRVPPTPGDQA